MIESLEDLANFIGAGEPTEASLSRRVYNDTPCGAWLTVTHTEEGLLRGVKLGSIIEGSDACVEPVELAFPFREGDWQEALQHVEDEAARLWEEAHEGLD